MLFVMLGGADILYFLGKRKGLESGSAFLLRSFCDQGSVVILAGVLCVVLCVC